MAERGGLLASFEYLDDIVNAIHELKKAGFKELRTFAPYPEHHIEEALGYHRSPVRVWTLVGGLTGAATGFALTIWTSLDWPLVTGGKPILSIPAYVVFAFELTMLFGALSTIIGLFINAQIPSSERPRSTRPTSARGRFGLYVPAERPRRRSASGSSKSTNPSSWSRTRRTPMRVERRSAVRTPLRLLLTLVLALTASSCTPMDNLMAAIFGRSMRNQPSFDPYENTRLPAVGSIPFASGNLQPGPFETSLGQPLPLEYDVPNFATAGPARPSPQRWRTRLPADAQSLERGKVDVRPLLRRLPRPERAQRRVTDHLQARVDGGVQPRDGRAPRRIRTATSTG